MGRREDWPDRPLDRRSALSGLAAVIAWPGRQQTPPETAQGLSVNSLTRMAATVRVNGREALFVLDTGAERTVAHRSGSVDMRSHLLQHSVCISP